MFLDFKYLSESPIFAARFEIDSAAGGIKGAVAQLVEQRTENPCVGGSIPPHTTDNVFKATEH